MNIVEAYLKFKGQYIILVSGLPGSGKTEIALILARELKFKYIPLTKFIKKEDYETVTNYKNVDYDKFNDFVNENKKVGIVCSGLIFERSKIKFIPDYVINFKSSKQLWFNKLAKKFGVETPVSKDLIPSPQEKSEDEKTEEDEKQKLAEEKLAEVKRKINAEIFPYYLEHIRTLKPTKFVEVTIFNEALIAQDVWKSLMHFTEEELKKISPQ